MKTTIPVYKLNKNDRKQNKTESSASWSRGKALAHITWKKNHKIMKSKYHNIVALNKVWNENVKYNGNSMIL